MPPEPSTAIAPADLAVGTGGAAWNRPNGPWELTANGIALGASALVHPNPAVVYRVRCLTICGGETADVQVQPKAAEPAWLTARRVQIAASIQHYTRRSCKQATRLRQQAAKMTKLMPSCEERFTTDLSPAERTVLYNEVPGVGRVLGVGVETLTKTTEQQYDAIRTRIQSLTGQAGR